jgi:hypothetical protein
MPDHPESPAITAESWGRLEVEGGHVFKDAKLWPGGAREWDWRETGTGHSPGIQPEDVAELVEHGAEVVILSRGRLGALKVPDATVADLRQRGVEVEVLKTGPALDRYGVLRREGRAVGALIHSTC